MSKNLINIGFKFRNSGTMLVPRENATDVQISSNVFKKLDKWLKWNKLEFTPHYVCPIWEKRVLEVIFLFKKETKTFLC